MSIRHTVVLALALQFASTGYLAADEPDQSASDAAFIKAIAEAWSHNRSRFETLICRYELTRRQTESIESALSGEIGQARGFAECEWRKLGDYQLVRINADPARNPETLIDGEDGFTYG